MKQILNYTEADLKHKNAYWTGREIEQQPIVWRKVADEISQKHADLHKWLAIFLEDPDVRIILTGAGTSAYVGDTLAPHLSLILSRTVESISTTDIVASPKQYLFKDRPTLVISFARSGNSPESVATCELCDQIINNVHHLIVTCNKDGALANITDKQENRYILTMPEETNDKSFAMTSSFTSMLLATALIFQNSKTMPDESAKLSAQILHANMLNKIKTLSEQPIRRVVCLGAGTNLGIAREASLKILELSNGRIDCYFESPLGFRHGPKLIIDDKTLVIILGSNDDYCKKYDRDLLSEITKDNKTAHVIYLLEYLDHPSPDIDDLWLAFPYILFCQILAFYKSLNLKITPDNPCPTGEANRVVQGVTIYLYGDC